MDLWFFISKGKKIFTKHEWKGNKIFLFGSEGYGLKFIKTSNYIDFLVKIKIDKNVESLNVSNSASVVFFHINKAKKILIII